MVTPSILYFFANLILMVAIASGLHEASNLNSIANIVGCALLFFAYRMDLARNKTKNKENRNDRKENNG